MSFTETVRKEWYRRSTRWRLARGDWSKPYWRDDADGRVVACRLCPKFDERGPRCSVPFGKPLRKCVAASLEAHLHATRGMKTLELGYGSRSLAREVVVQSGGSWTGLEPTSGRTPAIGKGGYGHAGHIPFPDATFDLVFGIQSIEHWEEKQPSLPDGLTYAQCLKEIWRVLKRGGSIYFDAPIHLHGHEMFVLGDLGRIRAAFDETLWTDVLFEKWRYDHEPLPKCPPPPKEVANWPSDLAARAAARRLESESMWMLALTANKRA
jgi:SAM-dependent methyltransferase